MASLHYLWKNRAGFPFGSKDFLKAWAKRIYSLPELFARNKSRNSLNRKGATVHECAEVNQHARVEGKKTTLSIEPFSFVGRAEMALHDKIAIGNNVCTNSAFYPTYTQRRYQQPNRNTCLQHRSVQPGLSGGAAFF